MSINPDASEQIIKKYQNSLKTAEQTLKANGITKYKIHENIIAVQTEKAYYTYGITTKKWSRVPTPTKGREMDKMIDLILKDEG